MHEKNPELQELEQQLSHPSGAKGIEIADMMNATNIGMTRASILQLNPGNGMAVLELGHGNAGHLGYLLEQAPGLRYTGLEISADMQAEARKRNPSNVENGTARFELYDGEKIPFDNAAFDRMFAVNCVYFWPEPEALLQEVHRVLKPGGLAAITFAHKDFMERLPFVGDRFRLYGHDEFTAMIGRTPFRIDHLHTQLEAVRTKTGDLVERYFTVGVLRR